MKRKNKPKGRRVKCERSGEKEEVNGGKLRMAGGRVECPVGVQATYFIKLDEEFLFHGMLKQSRNQWGGSRGLEGERSNSRTAYPLPTPTTKGKTGESRTKLLTFFRRGVCCDSVV